MYTRDRQNKGDILAIAEIIARGGIDHDLHHRWKTFVRMYQERTGGQGVRVQA